MSFIPVSQKPMTWVDCETTGLDEHHNDVIDIAIIRVERDGTETVFSAKVKMERPENAHPKALEVNGYTPEAWANARSAQEVFQEIHDRKLLQDCILAGHNVQFDARFINATFKRLGIDARVDYHLYDTVTVALVFLKPYIKSVSLVAVCAALGIPFDNAHTAIADCRMAMQVHELLTGGTYEELAVRIQGVSARIAVWEAQEAQKRAAR